MEEEEDDEFDGGVVVGQIPTVSVPRHIKKRALKNKALSVSFNEKDLNDYVTGFHKRKKKRRKEAEKQLKEKERLKRIVARKKRKEERESAYGGPLENPSAPGSEPDDVGSVGEEDELNITASVPETTTYQSGSTTITVTTREVRREDDELTPMHFIPKHSKSAEKNSSLSAKKPLKKVIKNKSRKKSRKHAYQKGKRSSK